MPRLRSAIASTILSLFSAVSLVGVDKAQAALLTYTFDADNLFYSPPGSRSFLKVDNSSLTGIEFEEIAVSEGRFYGYTFRRSKEYQDLAGATALFYQGEFRGLNTGGGDDWIKEVNDEGSIPPVRIIWDQRLSWSIETQPSPFDTSPGSRFFGYYELYSTAYGDGRTELADRQFFNSTFSYTLVDTEPEPVPEPLAVGGTALALAGLTWLKHKKKMAV